MVTIQEQTLIVLNIAMLLQMAGLAYAVQNDVYIKREHRRLLLAIVVIVLTLIFEGEFEPLDFPALFPTYAQSDFASEVLGIYGYIARPVVLVLFFRITSEDKRPWILVAANTLIHLVNLFVPVVFYYSEGRFHRGPLGYTCHVVSFLLLAWSAVASFKKARSDNSPTSAVPLLIHLMMVVATILDVWVMVSYRVSCLLVAIVSGCLFYYIWLHLQFAKAHEQAIRAEQRIQIMMSQIQPHFLYNTLATIQSLCLVDPERASDVLEKFATYLRQNLDSLDQPTLISLSRELEHVRIYAEIEMIRFPNIQVVYDIRDEDFKLPALTVQPIVENAIRHGVRGRKMGLVTVITFLEGGNHFVVIRDNGKGFDVSEVKEDEGSHIGLKNVRERVEQMCGGSVSVDSKKGKGTTVTIRIPAGGSEP